MVFVVTVIASFLVAFHKKLSIINEVKGIIEPETLMQMALQDASVISVIISLSVAILFFFIKLFMMIKRKEKIFPITTKIFRAEILSSLFMAYYFVFKVSKLTTNTALKMATFIGGFIGVLIVLVSLKGIIDGILIFSRNKSEE